jgi:hypothetical protein
MCVCDAFGGFYWGRGLATGLEGRRADAINAAICRLRWRSGSAGRDDAGEPSAPIRRVFGEDVAFKLGEVGRFARGKSEYSEFELIANSCVYRGHCGIDGVRAVKPVVALRPEGPRDFPHPSHQLGSPAARGEALQRPLHLGVCFLGGGPVVTRESFEEGSPAKRRLVGQRCLDKRVQVGGSSI